MFWIGTFFEATTKVKKKSDIKLPLIENPANLATPSNIHSDHKRMYLRSMISVPKVIFLQAAEFSG